MSIVDQFSRNLATPGATVVGATHQECLPQIGGGIWLGSFYQEELSKVEIGHGVSEACLCKGISACGLDVALTLAPCFLAVFARMSWFTWVE
jgi:hypothetical protein